MGRGNRQLATSGAKQLLYGRRPRRGDGPQVVGPAPTATTGEQDLLDNYQRFPQYQGGAPYGREIYFLAGTPTLTAGPTAKEYYGSVGIVIGEQGESSFIGWINYGPSGRGRSQGKVEYEGDSLNEAIAAVNNKLSKKQSTKARSTYQAGDGRVHFLSAEEILAG